MKFRLLLLVALSGTAFGQAVSYTSNVTQTANNVPPGASAAVMTTPNALISVCSYPPTGTPCTNTVAVFEDQAMAVPFTQPLTADPKGRFTIWAPAAQYYVSVQTASGANVGGYPLTLGGSGSGGSGTPGGVTTNAQFNNAGSFGGSKATFDAAGNFKSLSNDGMKNAYLNQTTPTSGDGLLKSLATSNSIANAGPDYTSTEGNTGVPFWRVPLIFFNTDFFWQTPVPFATNTFFNDQRLGTTSSSLGTFAYNPVGQSQGGIAIPLIYDRITHDQESVQPGHGQAWVGHQHDQSWTGSGINASGIWDGRTGEQFNFISTRRGISNPFLIQTQCSGDGDCHAVENDAFCAGGNSTGADEGCPNYRNQNIENQDVWTATSPSNQAPGATQILGNYIASSGVQGDGFPLLDSTQASGKCLITAMNQSPVFTTAGNIVSTCTYTPDNIGHLVTNLSGSTNIVPPKYNGATTTVTGVVVNGLTTALTTGEACWADSQRIESAQITAVSALSGGSQTVTVNLRYPHQVQAYVVQGPNNCKYVEAMANRKSNGPTNAPLRDWARIIGATDAHTLLYAAIGAGGYQPWPQGSFSTAPFAPMTITRDGTGHASTTVTSDFTWAYNNAIIVINTAVDASFNRTVGVAQTGFGTVTYTWADPGPAGTTTTTGASYILTNPINFPPFGIESNAYAIIPGCEVVYTGNATTHVMDGSNLCEYNNMTIASGDTLEVQHGNEIISNIEHNLITTWTPSSSSIASTAREEVLTGIPRPGFIWDRVQVGVDGGESKLFSAGGTLTPTSTYLDIVGDRIWNNFIQTPAPSAGAGAGALWLVTTCPLAGCTAQQDPYALIKVASPHSNAQISYSEYNTTLGFNVNNLNFMNMDGTGFNFTGNNGAGLNYVYNFNVNGSDLEFGNSSGAHVSVAYAVNSAATTLFDGAGNTSHVTQTPTSESIDVPIVGPAIAPSGACTVTGGWVFSRDGHATFCNAGTWAVKI